jgi:hypothetical protein
MRIVEFNLGFEIHDDLNPRLWDNDSLRPDIKSALLKIAQDFKTFIDVPFEVSDVLITGGQVSYYYTKHSDLDLHLVVDFDQVACEREAAELFDTKRLLYKQKYNVTVQGIPVELYVENKDYPAVSASYSLIKNQWIVKPKSKIDSIDTQEIERMSLMWQRVIGSAMASKDVKTVQKTIKMLRKYRRLGLKTSGEYGTPNLVYKTLRNSEIIQNVMNFLDQAHDRDLSI